MEKKQINFSTKIDNVNINCKHFNGYKPCIPHKKYGVHCKECKYYKPKNFRILILKVGAAGEILRNTPLLRKIHRLFPNAEITWLTNFPDFVPERFVNRILVYDWKNINIIFEEEFDLLLNLDKDYDICAVANKIKAKKKKGFLLSEFGKVIPADKNAETKWKTGIFDDLMLKNTNHYLLELFQICGWKWNGEKYILEEYKKFDIKCKKNKKIIGLNTGASAIWPTRIWPLKCWEELIQLIQKDYKVIILGGLDEQEKNEYLAKKYKVNYYGVKPYKEFIGIVDNCDLIVTSVTLALHIAIALEKKIILINNIFNKCEFNLYGLGEIIEPDVLCLGCYKTACDKKFNGKKCMELIKPNLIFETCKKLL